MNAAAALLVIVIITGKVAVFAGENTAELTREGKGYKATKIHEFKAKVNGKIQLTKITGDVTITSWNNNSVKIIETLMINSYTKEEAQRVLEDYTLRIKTQDDLIIAEGPESYRGYVNVKYSVTVPMKFSAEVATSGGDLTADSLNGDIHLKTSGGDVNIADCAGNLEIGTSGGTMELKRIKGTLDASTSGGDIMCLECGDDIELKTSGGDLDLRKLKGNIYAKTSGGDIHVLEVEGKCVVKTSGGEIRMNRITAKGKAEAYTSGGDIEVSTIEGNVELQTSGGEISGISVNGNVIAKTSGGDITMDNAKGNIVIYTSGGDLKVTGAEGFVEASTSSGDVEVEIAKSCPKKDQHQTLKSSGGDLELTLPLDFQGTVHALIKISGEDMDDYMIISEFPIEITRNVKEGGSTKWYKSGEITAEAAINGGGNAITLETTNGNIYIKKR